VSSLIDHVRPWHKTDAGGWGLVVSFTSFSKMMTEQGSSRFVNVIILSRLNWNKPIQG